MLVVPGLNRGDRSADIARTARLHRWHELCMGRSRAGHDCRPLSTSTTRKIHYIIRGALERAIGWRYLGVNKATMAEAQTPRTGPAERSGSCGALNAAWVDPEWGVLLWVTMITGSRRSEVSALCWRHADFDRAILCTAATPRPRPGPRRKRPRPRRKRPRPGKRRDGLSEAAARVCPAVVGSSCAAGRPSSGPGRTVGRRCPFDQRVADDRRPAESDLEGAAVAVAEDPVVLSGWVELAEVAVDDPLLRFVPVRKKRSPVGELQHVVSTDTSSFTLVMGREILSS